MHPEKFSEKEFEEITRYYDQTRFDYNIGWLEEVDMGRIPAPPARHPTA